jgi:hypothetical protein
MFLKEKYDSRGIFEKLKARLAAGGDVQDKSLYDNISSPTVQTNSVFIELSLAGWRNAIIVVVDITGAYLNADMIEDVFMSIDRILSEILIDIDPSYREYLNSNGKPMVISNEPNVLMFGSSSAIGSSSPKSSSMPFAVLFAASLTMATSGHAAS